MGAGHQIMRANVMAFKQETGANSTHKLSQAEVGALFARFDRHVTGRVSAALRSLPEAQRSNERLKTDLRKLVMTAARNRKPLTAAELKVLATNGRSAVRGHTSRLHSETMNIGERMLVKSYRNPKRYVFFTNKAHYKNNLRDELFGEADAIYLRVAGKGPNGKPLLARISREPEAIQRLVDQHHFAPMAPRDMVKHGALACHLVEQDDPHAYRAIDSMLVRKLYAKDGTVITTPSDRQRKSPLGQAVGAYLDAALNADKYGAFRLKRSAHIDETRIVMRRMPADSRNIAATDFLDLLEVPYEAKDGKLTITGDLNLENLGLTHLPDLSHATVNGDIKLAGNNLTDLTGSPQVVLGEYWANNCGISSLKGAPAKAYRGFYANGNTLTTLAHCPQEVGGSLTVANNQLISLEGAAPKVRLGFSCAGNKLETLLGGPQEVGYAYNCRDNRLISLEGLASKIGEGINCENNQLESLHGLPAAFTGEINCGGNPLTVLTGLPAEAGRIKFTTPRTTDKADAPAPAATPKM